MFFVILSLILFIVIMNISENKKHCIHLNDGNVLITFANNYYFEGKSENCIMEGYGKLTYADNSYYIGNFQFNMMNGYGKLHYNNHHLYESIEGSYINNVAHGPFILNFNNKNKFIFNYDYRDSNFTGTMYYPNNTCTYGYYDMSNATFIRKEPRVPFEPPV